ncbi:phage tail sheath family protein [Paenibacillus sp. 32352]|uniref:phage tail sheath family protein n=1 Tax=Paenibacillus sp. 32352 TaxID=1969111 RepID=UPI0009ADD0BE|nr:phage tail sheath family protein [Paenibacillus sp. 32352]
MAGGTWTTQNKDRAGVYIEFVGEGKPVGAVGDRGVMTMPLSLSWGSSKQMLKIQAGEDVSKLLGYDVTALQLLLVKEALKRVKTVLVYRLNEGAKAKATLGTLTATAQYGGLRGNDISLVIQKNFDDETKWDVKTLLAGKIADSQSVTDADGLKSNDWVAFSGTGALTETAGTALAGGTDGTVTNQDHMDYLAAAELVDFQTMALPSTDSTLKSVYTSFVRRLRDDEGKKVQVVLENYPTADYEGVISVKNGVILSDGTRLKAAQAVAWVAAATAGAQVNESLTYDAYDDAVDVEPRYTNEQIITAINNGEFVFTPSQGKAKVELDINTFTGFSPAKGKEFRKNRVIRVLDGINNDFKRIFESFFIGKVDNNADGRNLLRGECNSYLSTLQGINAVQNFDSQSDVVVLEGNEADSVYVEVGVQPVDSVEKIYMKVTVQ